MTPTAVLIPAQEGGFITFNSETVSAMQDERMPEAISNLREAAGLFLEEFPLKKPGRTLLTTFEIPAHA